MWRGWLNDKHARHPRKQDIIVVVAVIAKWTLTSGPSNRNGKLHRLKGQNTQEHQAVKRDLSCRTASKRQERTSEGGMQELAAWAPCQPADTTDMVARGEEAVERAWDGPAISSAHAQSTPFTWSVTSSLGEGRLWIWFQEKCKSQPPWDITSRLL